MMTATITITNQTPPSQESCLQYPNLPFCNYAALPNARIKEPLSKSIELRRAPAHSCMYPLVCPHSVWLVNLTFFMQDISHTSNSWLLLYIISERGWIDSTRSLHHVDGNLDSWSIMCCDSVWWGPWHFFGWILLGKSFMGRSIVLVLVLWATLRGSDVWPGGDKNWQNPRIQDDGIH